ncbi:caspase family protein [uncultured Maribacter sp.]|uniref:caspase family protein n=1 Tax=uncultured Maribacter sp. TaxID=431308 RepID=UPI0026380EAA|nr:caspase family protein [uncultured Maribacter sp.]
MNTERRFGIIIGINDYKVKPLDFCVNDADSIAQILEEKCRFEKKDIHLITSKKGKTTKDITGNFENALKEIEKDFVPYNDSVFFFFAGHGKYMLEKSTLQFHDSYMIIEDIFEKINGLFPKYQCYAIDACESGGKVLTRGSSDEDFLSKYISKSQGILFMYASTENESATEKADLNHGLFTNFFLQAINKEVIYDEDGILTPNRIQDYIAKETIKNSGFKQTPVIENRTIGYYPFAFKEKKEIIGKVKEQENKRTSKENKPLKSEIIIAGKNIDKEYFPEVPYEIRQLLFENIKPLVETELETWTKTINADNYEIIFEDNFEAFESDAETKLKDSVVKKSISEKVVSINRVFTSEREVVKQNPNPFGGSMSMISALMRKSETEHVYRNYINWNEKGILAKSIYLKSKSINKVSIGVSFLIYQAVYGIGLAKTSFYLDYNGYSNEIFKGPYTSISPYKFNENTISNILENIKSEIITLNRMINQWNEKRVSDIEDFDRRAE